MVNNFFSLKGIIFFLQNYSTVDLYLLF